MNASVIECTLSTTKRSIVRVIIRRRTTIITEKEDKCIIRNSHIIQLFHYTTDILVH